MTAELLVPEQLDLDDWVEKTGALARWISSGFKSKGEPLPEGFREIRRLEDHLQADEPNVGVAELFQDIKNRVGDTGRMELQLEPNSDGTHRVILRSRLITK